MINEIIEFEMTRYHAMIDRELEQVIKTISINELMFVECNLPLPLAPAVIKHFVLMIEGSEMRPIDEKWLIRKTDFDEYQAAHLSKRFSAFPEC